MDNDWTAIDHGTNGKSRRKAIADASGVQWWKQRDPLESRDAIRKQQ